MPGEIAVGRVVHAIHAVWNYHQCRARYLQVFGAWVFAEGYNEPADRDMNLMYVGDFMVELMAPRDKPLVYRKYLERYGEGWHSFELHVDDMPGALATLRDHGIRYSDGVPFTHPQDSKGLLIELVTVPMPNDPRDYDGWNPDWYRGNPLTLQGLAAIVVSVRDLDGAKTLLTELWGADVESEDRVYRPEPLDRCLLRLAGTRVMLVAPREGSTGPVARQMHDRSPGIYSLAWSVTSTKEAVARLDALGVRTEEGKGVLGSVSIDPAELFGARHELVQLND